MRRSKLREINAAAVIDSYTCVRVAADFGLEVTTGGKMRNRRLWVIRCNFARCLITRRSRGVSSRFVNIVHEINLTG